MLSANIAESRLRLLDELEIDFVSGGTVNYGGDIVVTAPSGFSPSFSFLSNLSSSLFSGSGGLSSYLSAAQIASIAAAAAGAAASANPDTNGDGTITQAEADAYNSTHPNANIGADIIVTGPSLSDIRIANTTAHNGALAINAAFAVGVGILAPELAAGDALLARVLADPRVRGAVVAGVGFGAGQITNSALENLLFNSAMGNLRLARINPAWAYGSVNNPMIPAQ
jgi:hypothetical protein